MLKVRQASTPPHLWEVVDKKGTILGCCHTEEEAKVKKAELETKA
jgi:hypothetical protein